MTLTDILSEKHTSIRKKWFNAIIDTYPPESAQFLKHRKNRFRNPVGDQIAQAVEGILSTLTRDEEPDHAVQFLDKIIKIRAVQDFSPSQAVRFMYLLKDIIREVTLDDVRKHVLFDELLALESRIDTLTERSFDIFMQCREKLYEIKANELHRWTYKIIENANLLKDQSNGGD